MSFSKGEIMAQVWGRIGGMRSFQSMGCQLIETPAPEANTANDYIPDYNHNYNTGCPLHPGCCVTSSTHTSDKDCQVPLEDCPAWLQQQWGTGRRLTPEKRHQILSLIKEGLKNDQIAQIAKCSRNTAKRLRQG
jgi:hypothetical protein